MAKYDKIQALIAQAISEALQQDVTPVFDTTVSLEYAMIYIEFTSKFSGKFWYGFDEAFCKKMTAHFTGMGEDEIDGELALDTSKELSNMMSSTILKKLDDTGNYSLSVPQIYTGEQIQEQKSNMPENIHDFTFKVGKHQFSLTVFLTGK